MFRRFALLTILSLTACSLPPSGILKVRNLTGDRVVATDARLRIVNNAEIATASIPGEVDPNRIICTEPSPDVATTIASSFSGGFNFPNFGNTSISAAQVEGLVQLGERTATIQLLRDKMYQTCLAYANGAISGTTYSFIMSRLDDTIVTLLMGETAGGAFGRELASIDGKADTSASATLSSLPGDIANLDERIAATAAAEEELRTAEENLSKHNAITPKPEDKEAHNARTTELETAVKKAEEKRGAVQRLMKDTLEVVSKSAAEISKIEGGDGLDATPDPLIAATLADMQAEFLSQDLSSSVVTACLVELGRKFGDTNEAAIEIFTGILKEDKQGGAVGAKRITGSELATFCANHLKGIIKKSSERHDKFRTHKATLRAWVDEKKYGARFAASSALANKAFVTAIKECKSIDDLDLQKACLKKLFKVAD